MKTKLIRQNRYVGIYVLVSAFYLSACNDGLLQTVDTTPLISRMKDEGLVLVLHGIVNYRSELYLCLYGDNQESLTSEPLHGYDSSGGIPYGRLTAVQFPKNTLSHGTMVYVKSNRRCPSRAADAIEYEDAIGLTFLDKSDSEFSFYAIKGYLSQENGGEAWSTCGESGDESCDTYLDGLGFGSGTFTIESTLHDMTRIRPDTNMLIDTKGPRGGVFDEPYTICWKPDDSSDTSMVTVCSNCGDYDTAPLRRFNMEPMTKGLLSVYIGEFECENGADTEPFAILELPAKSGFGDPSDTIEFGPNTLGYLFLVGVIGDNFPVEAAPRIVAIDIPGYTP